MSAAAVGYMPMPLDFKYKSVFLRGRPRHQKTDDFRIRHPPMSPSHWAKIFSPFDALDGFDEAIRSKDILYCDRRILEEGEQEDLDRKFAVLRSLTRASRAALSSCPTVSVTCFSPCTDVHNDSYGTGGRYETITGICRKVDDISRTITIDDQVISMEDIVSVSDGPDSSAG